jgi:hypothetical protein
MRSIVFVSALPVVLVLSLPGCCRKPSSDEQPPPVASSTAPVVNTPAPVAPSGPAVAFMGTYRKHAESVYKNGRRLSSATSKGSGELKVEPGKVTYAQTYPERGHDVHVTQIYSFTERDVVPHGTGFDVKLTFVSMESDTKNYAPDKNRPKLDVVKSVKGWEIGLVTTDDNGAMAGAEFDPS